MKKNYEYSFVRFVSMIMIIFCHTFEWIGYTLGVSEILGIIGNFLAVGVQMFFILSGILYGRKKWLFEKETYTEFIFRNYKKILKDYYIYAILVIFPVYFLANSGKTDFPHMIYNAFKVLTCSGVIEGVHHLWFIPYILFCYLITPMLYEIKKQVNTVIRRIIVLIGVLVTFEIIDIAFDSYFIATWINCYVVGFWGPDIIEDLTLTSKKMLLGLSAILLIPVTILWCNARYIIKPLCSGVLTSMVCEYVINFTRAFDALFLVVLAVCGGSKILGRTQKFISFLECSDRYSYDVFIVHMIYVKGAFSMLNLTSNYLTNIFCVLVMTIVSALILNIISNCLNISGGGYL